MRIARPTCVSLELWSRVFPLISGEFDHTKTKKGVKLLVKFATDPMCARLIAWLKATIAAKWHNDCLHLPHGQSPPGITKSPLVKLTLQTLVLVQDVPYYFHIAAGIAHHFDMQRMYDDITHCVYNFKDPDVFQTKAGAFFTNAAVELRDWGTMAELTFTAPFLRSMLYVAAKKYKNPDGMLEMARIFVQRADYDRGAHWLERYHTVTRRGALPAHPVRQKYIHDLSSIIDKAALAERSGASLILGWAAGDGNSVFVDRKHGVFGEVAQRVFDHADRVSSNLSEVHSEGGGAQDATSILEAALDRVSGDDNDEKVN